LCVFTEAVSLDDVPPITKILQFQSIAGEMITQRMRAFTRFLAKGGKLFTAAFPLP